MENEEGYQNIYIDSNVKLDTDDLFSLELILYQGAGSGYEQHKHYTVDKKTGKELSLKDLCGDVLITFFIFHALFELFDQLIGLFVDIKINGICG